MKSRCDASAGEDGLCAHLVARAVHGLSLIRVEDQLARAHAGAGRQALAHKEKQAVAFMSVLHQGRKVRKHLAPFAKVRQRPTRTLAMTVFLANGSMVGCRKKSIMLASMRSRACVSRHTI